MTYGTGWKPRPKDERDWTLESLQAMVEYGAAVPVTWDTPVVLNQGNTPECVGFAFATLVASASSVCGVDATVTDELGHRIYRKAKEIEGNDEPGTNLRCGAKAAKALGLIDFYAFGGYPEGEEWTQKRGPCVYGIPWTKDMYKPDSDYIIYPTGAYEGMGHAICRTMDEQAPADAGFVNSWSKLWGKLGRCFMTRQGLYQTMERGGRCAWP